MYIIDGIFPAERFEAEALGQLGELGESAIADRVCVCVSFPLLRLESATNVNISTARGRAHSGPGHTPAEPDLGSASGRIRFGRDESTAEKHWIYKIKNDSFCKYVTDGEHC